MQATGKKSVHGYSRFVLLGCQERHTLPTSPGSCVLLPETARVSSITPGAGRETLSPLITIQVETMRIRGCSHTISASLMTICLLRGHSQPSHQQFQPSKGTGIYAVRCSVARLTFIIIVTINLFYQSCRKKCGGASGR